MTVMGLVQRFVDEVLDMADLPDVRWIQMSFGNGRVIVGKEPLYGNQPIGVVSVGRCPSRRYSLHITNHPPHPVILVDTKERLYLVPSNPHGVEVLLKKAMRIIRRCIRNELNHKTP